MTITILLADDHAVVRDGLRLLLQAHSDLLVVGDAATGRTVISAARQLNPDVILLDIAMPELNGIEAAYQLGEVCPTAKIIILSMHATSEHIFKALQAGVRGYLLKESAGIEVVNAVRAVYAGDRYFSRKISDRMIDDYVRRRETTEIKSPLSRLTTREREILQLVVEGKSSADIGDMLGLSPKTVETYRSRLMQKLDIPDLPALVKFAIQHGLTPLE